jgi:hypothetical protein
VVFPLFAEAIRQPGEAPNLHTHREISALYMGRANPLLFRVSHDWDLLRCHYFGGAVSALIVLGLAINFDVLRLVATVV